MIKRNQLIYAMKNGVATYIEDVESGLKCGCTCPSCGEPLVAKKGTKRMHHFAHHAEQNCEYGYETSLHLAAKEILSKSKKIVLPPVYVVFPESYKKDELVSDAQELEIEDITLEKRFGDVIPDVVIYANGRQYFIEIFVTHRVDDEKLQKLRKADISTIEIDLSREASITSMDELTDLLLSDNDKKQWKYNSLANKYLQKFYQAADIRETVSHGCALHVDNCPIKMRSRYGKAYANFIDDCLYCKYCIGTTQDGKLRCSGRLRIATVDDFRTAETERIRKSNDELEIIADKAFASGICPFCGGKIVERSSNRGSFWGCNNYPHCRFTASVNPQTGEIIFKG